MTEATATPDAGASAVETPAAAQQQASQSLGSDTPEIVKVPAGDEPAERQGKAPANQRESVVRALRQEGLMEKGEAPGKPEVEAPTKPETKERPKTDAESTKPQPDKLADDADPHPEAPAKPAVAAPDRFNDGAKAEWEKAPEQVRHEVVRMQRELEKGLTDYKAKIEAAEATVAPIKPFMEMAEKHGAKIEDALRNYVEAEQALHANPVQALAKMAQTYVPGGLEAFVATLTGQPQGRTDPRDAQIAQLTQQVQQLTQGFEQNTAQQRAAQEQSQLRAVVTEISGQMPRFDELRPEMQRLIETGYVTGNNPRDVYAQAYELADRLKPAPVQQPAPPPPPAQTREATSIVGAPARPASQADSAPPASQRESIERAVRKNLGAF